MAVTLPTSTATVASEYAATSITFNRVMVQDASGYLVPGYSAQIGYARTDYLTDAAGNKLNIIQRNPPAQPPTGPDPYSGYVGLSGTDLAPLASTVPTTDLLTALANEADALIHADLLKRGLVTT